MERIPKIKKTKTNDPVDDDLQKKTRRYCLTVNEQSDFWLKVLEFNVCSSVYYYYFYFQRFSSTIQYFSSFPRVYPIYNTLG